MSEKISTSALAKMRQIEAKLLFADLKRAGYIVRQDEKWILTEEGAKFGGEYVFTLNLGSSLFGRPTCTSSLPQRLAKPTAQPSWVRS